MLDLDQRAPWPRTLRTVREGEVPAGAALDAQGRVEARGEARERFASGVFRGPP